MLETFDQFSEHLEDMFGPVGKVVVPDSSSEVESSQPVYTGGPSEHSIDVDGDGDRTTRAIVSSAKTTRAVNGTESDLDRANKELPDKADNRTIPQDVHKGGDDSKHTSESPCKSASL
jgi:hypothetical protein